MVHTVTSLAELQEVLSLKNLDHVVSLEIEFDYDGFHDVSDYSVLDPHPASFESLRYLELGISSSNEQLHRALADWLQEASPVAVHHDFGSKDAATLMLELARAGVYGRAYGATVVFPSRVDREALEACLGNEAFNVAHLRFVPYEGYDLPGVPEVVALMHERLREGLRELYWATELSEWSDVGAACARLPRLSTFAPVDGNFLNAHTRADYLEGFESLEELHRLAFVKWLVPQMQAPTVFGAKELKALQKIEGKPCDALYLSRYMDPNH